MKCVQENARIQQKSDPKSSCDAKRDPLNACVQRFQGAFQPPWISWDFMYGKCKLFTFIVCNKGKVQEEKKQGALLAK